MGLGYDEGGFRPELVLPSSCRMLFTVYPAHTRCVWTHKSVTFAKIEPAQTIHSHKYTDLQSHTCVGSTFSAELELEPGAIMAAYCNIRPLAACQ